MRNEQNYSTGTPLFLSLFFFVVVLVPGYNMSPCLRFYSHLYIHFSVHPVFFLKHFHVFFKKMSLCICMFRFQSLFVDIHSAN